MRWRVPNGKREAYVEAKVLPAFLQFAMGPPNKPINALAQGLNTFSFQIIHSDLRCGQVEIFCAKLFPIRQ